jgi:hypothetical protein
MNINYSPARQKKSRNKPVFPDPLQLPNVPSNSPSGIILQKLRPARNKAEIKIKNKPNTCYLIGKYMIQLLQNGFVLVAPQASSPYLLQPEVNFSTQPTG